MFNPISIGFYGLMSVFTLAVRECLSHTSDYGIMKMNGLGAGGGGNPAGGAGGGGNPAGGAYPAGSNSGSGSGSVYGPGSGNAKERNFTAPLDLGEAPQYQGTGLADRIFGEKMATSLEARFLFQKTASGNKAINLSRSGFHPRD